MFADSHCWKGHCWRMHQRHSNRQIPPPDPNVLKCLYHNRIAQISLWTCHSSLLFYKRGNWTPEYAISSPKLHRSLVVDSALRNQCSFSPECQAATLVLKNECNSGMMFANLPLAQKPIIKEVVPSPGTWLSGLCFRLDILMYILNQNRIQITALPLTSYVTVGKIVNLSVP